MKKISLFALAFAVVGLSACAEEAEPAVDETNVDAEVVTPVEPADEMMDDAEAGMEEMGEDMEAAGDEMEAEMEAATDEMEAEMDEAAGE